ncbi:MAG: extracellular solute-binding protein [Oscillospiraceae bacterium]
MRKNMKQIIAIALATLMTAASLAGCGEKSPENTSSSNGQSSDGNKTHNIKVLCPENTNTFLKFADREEYPVYQELVELFAKKGLTVEYEVVPDDQYMVVAQTRLATGTDLPDWVNVQKLDTVTTLNLASNKTLLPVNKILEEYGDGTALSYFEKEAPFVFGLSTAEDGNMYWIPNTAISTYEGKPGSTCQTILIRKDWLEKLNLEVPKTAEDFITLMKAFRDKDANGNGVADEILALDASKFRRGIAQWFGLGTDLTAVMIEEGKVVSPWYQEGAKDYFAYMQRLVKEGILDPTLVGAASKDAANQKMAENKVGATYDYTLQSWLEPSINAENPEFLPIGPLTAVDGIKPVRTIEPPQLAWRGYAVTKGCKDQEGIAKFIDTLYSQEYFDLSLYGIDGKTSKVVDGKRVVDEEVVNNTTWEKMAKDRNTTGGYLWGDGTFPKTRNSTMEEQLEGAVGHKANYQKEVIFYQPTSPDNNDAYLALPTKEQIERKAEIKTDIDTYSKELMTQLILGHKSLNDWDLYMSELKELGLDELIAIDQELADRYNGK